MLSCDDRSDRVTSPAAAPAASASTAMSDVRKLPATTTVALSTSGDRGATSALPTAGVMAAGYPDSQSVNTAATALYLAQTGSGAAAHFLADQRPAGHFETFLNGTAFATVYARSSGSGDVILAEKLAHGGSALRSVHFGNGNAAFVWAQGNGSALHALGTSSGTTLVANKLSPTGGAASLSIQSRDNSSPVLLATTNGRGRAGQFTVDNTSNGGEAMRLSSNGPGSTLFVQRLSTGAGSAAVVQSTSFQSTGSALLVNNAGSGFAATVNAAGAGGGLRITTAGGPGLQVVGGVKNAVVATSSGARALYSEESTEVWFTDYGAGRLHAGRARVSLDPLFAETVTLTGGYHVFVQSYGDATLIVRNRSGRGFDVVRRDGSEDADFSYRVVGRRKGFDSARLERAPWADGTVGGGRPPH